MSNSLNSDLLAIAEEEKANRATELVVAIVEKAKREAELVIANVEKAERAAELVIAKEEKAKREAELVIANKEKANREAELVIANIEKAKREAELVIANKEKANREEELEIANAEKAMRAAEVIISNTGKAKRAAKLVIANAEKAKSAAKLLIADIEKEKNIVKLIDADKELSYQYEEKIKLAAELVIADINKTKLEAELAIANIDKAKRAAELVIANKEVDYQKGEKTQRASELVVADAEKSKRESELVIANIEKAKRAAELVIANIEKTKRSAELVIANKELVYQKGENAKRAAELLIANVEKAKQAAELVIANIEKAKRAAQFIVMNKELRLAKEKEKLVAELTIVNKELFLQITERKMAEVALLESENEFRLLAEAMPQIVWITRSDGLNNFFNKQWVDYTGLTLEESYGSGWNKPFHPDDQQRAWDAWQNAITNMATYSLECRLRRFDGEYKWWLIRGVPVLDADGVVLKWFGTCTDIDEIKNGEERLQIAKHHAEESDHLKSAFLANMSHEIRTPMNGILGFTDLLKDSKLTGEEQAKYIGIIEKSGARLLNIINDIIDISKIEAGLMKLDMMETNINKQIEYIFTFFKPEVEAKGMKFFFRNSLPEKEATLKTDSEKLYAILTNLVKNAIKYSYLGEIEIGYKIVQTQNIASLQFYVKDTGIGIPKDRHEAIFERFIQADITNKMANQGAGLGLSITKAYVEMLGGKIWVESEVGIGSTFYFTLPYIAEPREKSTVKNDIPVIEDGNMVKKLKILIAEDDESSSQLISIYVQKFRNKIINVQTGTEALEACRDNPDIDLILMDIQMPGMNGYEATRQIRQFNTEVIIIALTAFALTGDREKALKAGCNDYISKPIKKDELNDVLKKYFG